MAFQVHKGAEDSGTNLGTQSCDTRGPWEVPPGDTTMPSLPQAGRVAGTAQSLEPSTGQVGGGGQAGSLGRCLGVGRGSRGQGCSVLGPVGLGALDAGPSVPHQHLPHGALRRSRGPRVGGTQNSIRHGSSCTSRGLPRLQVKPPTRRAGRPARSKLGSSGHKGSRGENHADVRLLRTDRRVE